MCAARVAVGPDAHTGSRILVSSETLGRKRSRREVEEKDERGRREGRKKKKRRMKRGEKGKVK